VSCQDIQEADFRTVQVSHLLELSTLSNRQECRDSAANVATDLVRTLLACDLRLTEARPALALTHQAQPKLEQAQRPVLSLPALPMQH